MPLQGRRPYEVSKSCADLIGQAVVRLAIVAPCNAKARVISGCRATAESVVVGRSVATVAEVAFVGRLSVPAARLGLGEGRLAAQPFLRRAAR